MKNVTNLLPGFPWRKWQSWLLGPPMPCRGAVACAVDGPESGPGLCPRSVIYQIRQHGHVSSSPHTWKMGMMIEPTSESRPEEETR